MNPFKSKFPGNFSEKIRSQLYDMERGQSYMLKTYEQPHSKTRMVISKYAKASEKQFRTAVDADGNLWAQREL